MQNRFRVDFSKRSMGTEIMDDLDCHGEVVDQTLRELDFINQWLGGNVITIQAVKSIWKTISKQQPLRIADLGCGSGEMLRILSSQAEKENRKVVLTGFDANPHIVDYARNQSTKYLNISFESVNVFTQQFQEQKFDLVLATLFMHHFTNTELISLFTSLRKQSKSIVINDIHRHWLAYHAIKLLTRFFSKSAMVKFDAPLSVMRSFSKNELKDILCSAGITNFSLKWKWAFRWQLIIHPHSV
jgi:2-polyprenyl-3-methyl-5-hydroxy-6-metoxy-1,4-benzoquinol methylase